MGNVNQEAILFNDTIYNNITFGVKEATRDEVIAAAKVANAHDFIMLQRTATIPASVTVDAACRAVRGSVYP